MAEVKFCGMTRAEDVREAVRLGAGYVGVIFTTSPRRVNAGRAREVLAPATGSRVRRVGVFGAESIDDVVRVARDAGVDIVQAHGPREPGDFDRLRTELGVEVWSVIRIGAGGIAALSPDAFREGDATVLDTFSAGALGGTGQAFDWDAVASRLPGLRGARPLVVAGGLRPGNVRDAIERLAPDVVDVSSGVEASPGVKNHELMADFMAAAAAATPSRA